MILVFYAGQVAEECESISSFRNFKLTCGQEIYNGAYVHDDHFKNHEPAWYRMDGTPVLLDDVPKELRLLVLLLT